MVLHGQQSRTLAFALPDPPSFGLASAHEKMLSWGLHRLLNGGCVSPSEQTCSAAGPAGLLTPSVIIHQVCDDGSFVSAANAAIQASIHGTISVDVSIDAHHQFADAYQATMSTELEISLGQGWTIGVDLNVTVTDARPAMFTLVLPFYLTLHGHVDPAKDCATEGCFHMTYARFTPSYPSIADRRGVPAMPAASDPRFGTWHLALDATIAATYGKTFRFVTRASRSYEVHVTPEASDDQLVTYWSTVRFMFPNLYSPL